MGMLARRWQWAAAFVSLGACSCVADPDVKLASQRVTLSLDVVHSAETRFEKQILDEIDRTREQVSRAIVAALVYDTIEDQANNLESKGDFIALSAEITSQEQNARALVEKLLTLTTPAPVAPVAPAAGAPAPAAPRTPASYGVWFDKRIEASKQAIARTEQAPEAVRREQEHLGRLEAGKQMLASAIEDLIRLNDMRAMAAAGTLRQLETHLAVIRATHAELDRWIQTDVTVKGEDIAKLTEDAVAKLGGPGAAQ
jgi:hypothetical protein